MQKSLRVLVVDDMTSMRKFVIKCLKELGITDVVEANSGKEAYRTLVTTSPEIQLVLSDWNMASGTGLQLLQKIRSEARFKNLPFIMVTAETEKKDIVKAIQAGANSYVNKPFDAQTLGKKIESIFSKLEGSEQTSA